jgi:hypothetical protein
VGSHDTELKVRGTTAPPACRLNQRPLVQFSSFTPASPDFRYRWDRRTDIHDVGIFWNYRWHPKSGPLIDWGPNSSVDGV